MGGLSGSMADMRLQLLNDWLANSLRLPVKSVKPVAGDASFRRYFRVTLPDITYIAMDAPPEKEKCQPFIAIGQEFRSAGIHTPAIIKQNTEKGFLLLEDFGNELFLTALNETNTDSLYRLALAILPRIQKITQIKNYSLPRFDEKTMLREMQLFEDWFIKGLLAYPITPAESANLQHAMQIIANKISTFTYTCMHRDYHSRNLMLLANKELGILDFQDAVYGPAVYDAVSLLKDCYIAWPREKIITWLGYYHKLLINAAIIPSTITFDQLLQEFDWVGIQRHLKVAGIFSRLYLRDGKASYLKDIPLAIRYLMTALQDFPQLAELTAWLQENILPLYTASVQNPLKEASTL